MSDVSGASGEVELVELLTPEGERLEHPEDSFSGGEREPANEDTQSAERDAFVIAEEGVAPVNGGFECPLPRKLCVAATGEQPVALFELRRDALRGELSAARRGELDRKRYAIDAVHTVKRVSAEFGKGGGDDCACGTEAAEQQAHFERRVAAQR